MPGFEELILILVLLGLPAYWILTREPVFGLWAAIAGWQLFVWGIIVVVAPVNSVGLGMVLAALGILGMILLPKKHSKKEYNK